MSEKCEICGFPFNKRLVVNNAWPEHMHILTECKQCGYVLNNVMYHKIGSERCQGKTIKQTQE